MPSVTLQVILPDGASTTIDAVATDTVKSLHKRIAEATGIDEKKSALVFDGKALRDGLVQEYPFEDQSTVELKSECWFEEMKEEGVLVDLSHVWYRHMQYKSTRGLEPLLAALQEASLSDHRTVGYYYHIGRVEGGLLYDGVEVSDSEWPVKDPVLLACGSITWGSPADWRGSGTPSDQTSTQVGRGWDTWRTCRKIRLQ
eukprot:TRINITY_DN4337_c0_g1_i1.p1 TRINITY_DN4337_c0_g1~~TRINITY_DN4337_c0_g1_i1.p1  ORF type:complete len:200 (+),score=20.98 TRINITY_DN4337_c0_g1_i1:63-662(+)